MAKKDALKLALEELRELFPAKARQNFLDDIFGQIEEEDWIQDVLKKRTQTPKYVAVTCDRRRNDKRFSYAYFDFLLFALDRASGGVGTYKPNNQIRALRWNGSRPQLLRILHYFSINNATLNFRRVLVLPFPLPIVGLRVDVNVHKK